MVQVSYPGVYIQERASGVRPLSAVSTSIAAFVDFFREGPMNKAVRIHGMADFERVFGGVDRRSSASYQIAQFFLNGGNTAHVVRVASNATGNAVATASVGARDANSTKVVTFSAANAGLWGNTVRAVVDLNGDGTFNVHARRYASTDPAAREVASDPVFTNLSMDDDDSNYFKDVIDEGASLIDVTHHSPATNTDRPRPCGTIGAAVDVTSAPTATTSFTVTITVGAGAPAVYNASYVPPAGTSVRELRRALERAIRGAVDATGTRAPATVTGATVTAVTGATSARLVVRLKRGADGYDPAALVSLGTSSTGLQGLGFDGAAGEFENVQEYELGAVDAAAQVDGAAGADGVAPEAAELVGSASQKTGIYALKDVDLFNILCLPRAVELSDAAETTFVISRALELCAAERAFMIIDPPTSDDTVEEILDWLEDNANYRDKNAAVYFPCVYVPDPENDYRPRAIGASGTIAGIYAYTDATRGVWKAPAGIDAKLKGVVKLGAKLTDDQNGVLNPVAINCLRTFAIHGQVVWGARTLDGSDAVGSEWKYIPIRRLTLMIEESLFRGTKWVVFEPNDEPLWAKVRQNVRAFMMDLYRQGAFQGSSPDKAFYVKCDGETTTALDRQRGIVNIEVGFAPLKPAEFVVITIQQIPDIG